ncbi:outer membrane protein assembly factor BamA [Uliginosibacterium gangwonense]|uniref:outer membrane protein assembly factor BamA n=1 Tax=Uliginosibacterium gangwonense TaxID=392736 RepID=UPI00036DF4AB|nr:outer membrane protein assembly factor BamA [Uliginosibacterium gangwonense]
MSRSLTAISAGVCALFSPLVFAAAPFVVKDIRVEGMQRTDAGTVFNYLPIKVGDKVDDAAVSRAIKTLYATGFFKDVRIEVDKEVLVVVVDERPAISQIAFSGNKEFDSENLLKGLKEVGIAESRTFDRSQLERAEQEIKRLYLTKSFYSASVKTTVSPQERNRVAINFEITEGDEAKIKSIRILGAKAFKEKQLLGLMNLEETGSWYDLFQDDKYSKQKLQGDIEEVRSWYMDRGYINFNVESSQVSITPDKKDVYISLTISEGEQYKLSSIRLAGDLVVPEKDLRKLVKIKRGDIYSRAKINDISKALADRLSNDGYAFANVNASPDVDDKKKEVALTFFVDPGRRVYVNRINVLGNAKTRDEVVRRELIQFENSLFDRQKLDESKKRIERTGNFSDVTMDTLPVEGTTDQVDVNVSVKERSTGTLSAGVGYSQTDKFVLNGSISQTNLFGTGNAASITISNGSTARTLAGSFTDPYWTKDGVSRSFDLAQKMVDSQSTSIGRYATHTDSGGVRFGIPISLNDTIFLGESFDRTRISIYDDSPQQYKDFVEKFGPTNTTLSSSVAWANDTRDSSVTPTSGIYQQLGLEVATPPMDLRYTRLTYQIQHFTPIASGYALMLSGQMGSVQAYGGQGVPFYKNYYAGGIGSLRTFKDNSLGPRVHDASGNETSQSLGGTRRALATAELFFPVPGMKEKNAAMRMSAFIDAGSLWGASGANNTYAHSTDIRVGAGFALSWTSPIGPLSFSFGKPLVKKPGDQTQSLQFQIGSVF